jgi:hypothetical protein
MLLRKQKTYNKNTPNSINLIKKLIHLQIDYVRMMQDYNKMEESSM